MKKLLIFCLIMATTFALYAQTLNGVSQFNVGTCFTSVDWEVSYSFQMVPEGVAIQFYNPRITVSSSSDYYTKGQRYSKQSLGLSSWPDENQNPQNMVISFTVSHIDGYGNYITSQPCNNGKFAPTIVLRKSNVKNWENISINSFRVISTERMMYNNIGSIKVDNIIEAKKNNSNNNTQTSTNASGQAATSSAATTTPVQIPDDYKGNPMTYNTNGGSNTNTSTNNYDSNTGLYTNPLKVNNSSAATNQNSTSNTTTTNSPLDNYDSNTGLYSNPLAIYNSSATSEFQKNYETGQQIGTAVVGIIDLFSPSPEELQRREREENLRIEREEKAARARAEKARNITLRKELIKKYPDGKTPLSNEAKNSSEVYFFVYSYKESTIENDNPTIYISNVFALQKYADGTWPFKTSLMQKIAKENKDLEFILSGYYESKTEAVQQHQYFANRANSSAFAINGISFEIKKSSESSTSQTDFWGNSNKNAAPKPTSNNNNANTDFWGNPTKPSNSEQNISEEKKQDSPKKKTKVDFWGNPIKD